MSSQQETVPAVPAPSTTAQGAATSAESPAQANKFDNVGKTVGTKVKSLFNAVGKAGEHVRGNINAALDGTGDAIAGRKSSEVTSKGNNPVIPAATETPNPVAESSAAGAIHEDNSATPAAGEKKFPVGQFINKSFKRTVEIIKSLTNNLRSNVSSGVDGVGSTISQGKNRASKRFSRSRPEPQAEESAAVSDTARIPPTNTVAEAVPPPSHPAIASSEPVAAA